MTTLADGYMRLAARFAAWVSAQADLRLALVVGSRARATRAGDDWADLDLVLFTTAPEQYEAVDWLAAFGELWVAYRGQIASGAPEWMVVYADGLDVDVAVLPVEAPMTPESLRATGLHNVLARGHRVLVDRDGLTPVLSTYTRRVPPLPDGAAFDNTVQRFWRYAERAAKKLRRGELWMAKDLCDRTLKDVLLTMIEWHGRAGGDPAVDTWYEGHFLEAWADPRVLAGLGEAFAHYDEADIRRALLATMELFGWLARETAARLGYGYASAAEDHITGWVGQLLAGK